MLQGGTRLDEIAKLRAEIKCRELMIAERNAKIKKYETALRRIIDLGYAGAGVEQIAREALGE